MFCKIKTLNKKYDQFFLQFEFFYLTQTSWESHWFFHKELSDDINALEENAEINEAEIKHDKTFIKKMEDSTEMETFAREKYYLKKENEDIYIIEHEDSLKNQ